METYEQALFDAHGALLNDIELKMSYKDIEYIEGMLDAARIVLTMMRDELNDRE